MDSNSSKNSLQTAQDGQTPVLLSDFQSLGSSAQSSFKPSNPLLIQKHKAVPVQSNNRHSSSNSTTSNNSHPTSSPHKPKKFHWIHSHERPKKRQAIQSEEIPPISTINQNLNSLNNRYGAIVSPNSYWTIPVQSILNVPPANPVIYATPVIPITPYYSSNVEENNQTNLIEQNSQQFNTFSLYSPTTSYSVSSKPSKTTNNDPSSLFTSVQQKPLQIDLTDEKEETTKFDVLLNKIESMKKLLPSVLEGNATVISQMNSDLTKLRNLVKDTYLELEELDQKRAIAAFGPPPE
jgi:hypothetical protein